MTTDVKDPGGVDALPGGDDDKSKKTDQTTPPAKDSVAYDTYKKAVDEAKAAKAKVAEFEKAKREAEESKLKQDGEYKKLLEQREQELEEERKGRKDLETKINESRKLNAFLNAVSGEVPKQYWSLIDLENVAVDPETGMPDESSVKRAAEKFEKEYADVIKKPSKSKLPNDAPKGGAGKLSYDSWLKLPLKDQLERMKDVDRSTM
jgi:dsDNA-specific endonuclease/ATPase MutS2